MPNQTEGNARLVVGMISGTSMDGIDAALVRITGPATQPRVRLLAFDTYPYPLSVRQRVLRAAAGEAVGASGISQLNFLLGELFAEAALRISRAASVSPTRLAAIGSHGQTIYHQGAPTRECGRKVTSTLQIGEPAVIAERTGAPVVADFRPADMATGGQGAPLVPLVDYLLLRDARHGSVALNIGGIANFTVVPAAAKPEQVFGFDTGPGNMIIDGLVRHFTGRKKIFDAGGRWAARGRVVEPILTEALRDSFFRRQPPKSAGREQFGETFIKQFFLKHSRARQEDLLCTATELTARTITDALGRFVLSGVEGATRGVAPSVPGIERLIVSGGGAHNRLLVSRLAQLLPCLRVRLSDAYGLPVDAKEAIAFAVLADRTMHGLPGNLPTVTGACRAVVLGKIARP